MRPDWESAKRVRTVSKAKKDIDLIVERLRQKPKEFSSPRCMQGMSCRTDGISGNNEVY
jgi:hypothetical protein